MKPFKLISRGALGVAVLATLAACGGGSGSDAGVPPVAANEVPTSATATTLAYSQYTASVKSSESADPLSLAKVTNAPTSETEEPIEVN